MKLIYMDVTLKGLAGNGRNAPTLQARSLIDRLHMIKFNAIYAITIKLEDLNTEIDGKR